MTTSFICLVCGFPNLAEQPRHADGGGSDEICPSCGFQFGYDDNDRGISFEEWRSDWIRCGILKLNYGILDETVRWGTS